MCSIRAGIELERGSDDVGKYGVRVVCALWGDLKPPGAKRDERLFTQVALAGAVVYVSQRTIGLSTERIPAIDQEGLIH